MNQINKRRKFPKELTINTELIEEKQKIEYFKSKLEYTEKNLNNERKKNSWLFVAVLIFVILSIIFFRNWRSTKSYSDIMIEYYKSTIDVMEKSYIDTYLK